MGDLKYINIPAGFCSIKNLDLPQIMILSLAASFSNGLKMSNERIGRIVRLSADRVSRLISDLKLKGYVRIENPQSRYRRIYFVADAKVETDYFGEDTIVEIILLRCPHRFTSVPTPNRKESKGKKEYVHSFDTFWCAYPKHRDKGRAQKAWEKLEPAGELLEKIIAGAKDVARRAEAGEFDGSRGRLQFCKHPTTWLTAEAWNDEPDEPEYSTKDITEDEADELMREVSGG